MIPTANQYGINLEQVGAGYAIMTSKGIKSAESTTYMASAFQEMGKSGTIASKTIEEASGKSFPELIKSGKSVGDVLNIMNEYAKKNGKSLTDMFGSAEAGKAALMLSGDAGKEFNEMLGTMNKSAGATDTAFAKVNNTAGMRLQKSLNSLKNSAIKLGDALTPIVEKMASGIQKLADKFNKLTPAEQENIVKTGLIVAAIGPVLSIIGNLVIALGGVLKVLGFASTLMGISATATAGVGAAGAAATPAVVGIGAAFGAALIPLLPWIAAAGAVVAIGFGIKHVLSKEVIPKVDLFADSVKGSAVKVKNANGEIVTSYNATTVKIDEGTKKAVGSYLELDKGATDALNNLYINSTTITGKTVADVTTKYNTMNTTVKTAMDKRFADEYKTMTDFYAKSDVMTTKEEAAALEKMKKDHETEKAEEDKSTKAILAIYKKAADENREISLEDEEAIKAIQNRKKTTAITVMSKGEEESKVILDRMKAYGSRVTAEQAGKEIENANKSRDGTVKAANEEYNKRVAAIKATCDQSTPQGKKMADSLIKDAERQKRMSIEQAEILRHGVVGKIMAMNSENEGKINTSTGKVIKTLDRIKSWMNDPSGTTKTYTITTKYVSLGEKTEAAGRGDFSKFSYTTPKGSGKDVFHRATGDRNFKGGLTTLHEKGYEVYNLNRGSQVLNHEASLDLMTKTAQEVAKGVLSSKIGRAHV